MSEQHIIISTRNTLEALGLRSILSEQFGIEAHICTSDNLKSLTATLEPNLFFIDSPTLLANMTFFLPRKTKTIVLTTTNDTTDDMQWLNVNQKEEHIINAINNLFSNNKQDDNGNNSTLSQREIEVLRLIASGRLNKEIAQELNISINTVLTHRKNITAKLGIKSISGLSFYAMMNGIV